MYRILISFTFFFGFFQANAQSLCLGNDTTVCAGSPVQIQLCGAGGGAGPQGIVLSNPTTISLSDDQWSGAVNMGFNFSFYGNTYNQCVIGSNAIITFDLTEANGYCSWALGGIGALPNPTFDDALNSVMPAYQDINPNAFTSPNGAIQYETIGTAPNRMFVVLYKDINFFSCTSVCNYIATIFYETTNQIEVHIGEKPLCVSWNNGLAIQGIQNSNGTLASITPGRNNTQWAANQDGRRWTPTSPSNTSNYTLSQIPYILVTSPNTTFQWENTLGQTFPYNNGVLNIPSAPADTVGYFMSGAACSASLGSVTDTSWIIGTTVQVSASMTPDICSSGQGTVSATPTQGFPPFTYNWPGLNSTSQTVTNVYGGTYTVEMTDSLGCTATANVTVSDTPAQYTSSSTEVSCPGGSDGTATADMVPQIGAVSYLWDDPLAQTTSTATGLSAGTYTCTISSNVGCSTTISVTVTEIPGMTATIASQSDVTCNSGDDGMITVSVAQGTAPYSYSWDNSSSTTNVADDLAAGTHTCTITDANGCVITISGTINEPPALAITSLTPDTQICPEDDITLTVSGTGGSSTYTFTWFENGTAIGTGNSITVDPENTNTQYCVELSEVCGSPTVQQCMTVSFPTPIIPSALPDEAQKCVPNHFLFTNTSSNPGEIATTFWEFNDHPDHNALVNGTDTISHYFDQIGTHTITMTITSIYGCVYTDTLVDLIEALPSPTAAFGFSANPATVFETVIQMQNQSSLDVVHWQWVSPYSNPISSNQGNPVFTFPEGEAGVYPVTLYVTTDYGCTDSVTIDLHVIEDILFYAPNAFTPDGDEFNQSWKPEIMGIDIYDFELLMFNRWGEVIWESHDPNVGWDGTYNGKLVPAGTYVWTARVKSPMNDDKKTFTGSVVILK